MSRISPFLGHPGLAAAAAASASAAAGVPGAPPGHLPHLGKEYADHHHHHHGNGRHPEKESPSKAAKKEPHIKKPLNAFMLYMKEMRPVVQAECTLKESAAIYQDLGLGVRIIHGGE